jgi:hypothetical protein
MPIPPAVWTLNASDINPAGSIGQKDLAGCHITENNAGTAYEFTEPNINKVLSTTTGSSLPSVPFSFPVFTYKGLQWNISVSTLPVGASGTGTWSTPGSERPTTGIQSGDFVAQSGSGLAKDKGAASAKA